MTTYRYSRWDGSQHVFDIDEDDVLDQLSDEVLAHGDLDRALRSLFRRGIQSREEGKRIEGLQDLMERLKKQRQRQLQRYHLDSLMDDLKERLKDVVETERRGIDRRLEEAGQQLEEAGDDGEHLHRAMQVLEERAQRGKETLDNLPDGVGGAIRELKEYDFLDSEARQKFQELLDALGQQMVQNLFESMRQQLQELGPDQMEGVRDMLRALNQMLRERASGLEPDFQGFKERYGQYFGPNPPSNLDELIERLADQMAAMQSLIDSMTPEMRGELESLMESAMDAETMREMAELASRMYDLSSLDELTREYPFAGDEPLTLQQAMEVMKQLQDLEELERQIRQVTRSGDINDLDLDKVEQHLGEDARRQLEELERVVQKLEEAGYLRREGDRVQLTARAIRKLGQKALREVFAAIKRDRAGGHETYHKGAGDEHTGETKVYEFGDPLDVDLNRTIRNSILSHGPQIPVRIGPTDLEVHRTEHLSQAATVLLLDQSRSMGILGSFAAAKKVALALYWLIHTQYPRDQFFVVGFSDYAMEIKPDDLAEVTWNAWVSGTNMQHALMLSRKLLSRHQTATRQVLMITDGEPTAHLENGHAYFNYPPSYRTIEETLKEVKRCSRQGITINTFMLETSYYLVDFVDKMTRINRGRAFYTTPGQLGRYVMVDYLKSRRKLVGQTPFL